MTTTPRIGWVGIAMVFGFTGANFAAEPEPSVRPAYKAGSWYPDDADELAKRVDALLDEASPVERSGKPLAVIAPHAGYRYSAAVAAAGYRCLKGHTYKRVVVLAFSHSKAASYEGIDVPRRLTAYETPLGQVTIDRAACDLLLGKPSFAAHKNVDVDEHSLELQLPFLQRTLGAFQLVPLLIGRMSHRTCVEAAEAILPLLDGETLLVASSDFTHFGSGFGFTPFREEIPERLRALADDAARAIERVDCDGFVAHLDKTKDTICGRAPIRLLLRILSMSDGAEAVRTAFDTSGNLTGDWSHSVTYQSFVIFPRRGTLGTLPRRALLELARRTISAHLKAKKAPTASEADLPDEARIDGACFVTLENSGRLRGCIGNMEASGPLSEAVIRNAISACQDSRFVSNPVTASELSKLDIEISYLTPMKTLDKIEEIIVGRHGLLISREPERGVLLPQVAARRGWTREEFLAQTCRKAGLPQNAWKEPGTTVQSFEAEVFGEEH